MTPASCISEPRWGCLSGSRRPMRGTGLKAGPSTKPVRNGDRSLACRRVRSRSCRRYGASGAVGTLRSGWRHRTGLRATPVSRWAGGSSSRGSKRFRTWARARCWICRKTLAVWCGSRRTAACSAMTAATCGNSAPADASQLMVRYKPSEDRIVAGGLPGIPALPAGPSVWRYLSLEAAETTAPADLPWWTREGRLIPPPATPDAPGEGRYDVLAPPPPCDFDESVFTYNPAAGVWFECREQAALSVLGRLKKLSEGETTDPVVGKRAADGAQQVRPAGGRVAMAVEETAVGA